MTMMLKLYEPSLENSMQGTCNRKPKLAALVCMFWQNTMRGMMGEIGFELLMDGAALVLEGLALSLDMCSQLSSMLGEARCWIPWYSRPG